MKPYRYIITDSATVVAASFTISRSITLQQFPFLTQGDSLAILVDLWAQTEYDLIATAGQFAVAPARVALDGLNDQSQKMVRSSTGTGATGLLYFPDRVYMRSLLVPLETLVAPLTITANIAPGTGVTAASIQSIRLSFGFTIDLWQRADWNEFALR